MTRLYGERTRGILFVFVTYSAAVALAVPPADVKPNTAHNGSGLLGLSLTPAPLMTGRPAARKAFGPDHGRVQPPPHHSPVASGIVFGADTCAATTTVPVSVGPLGSPNTVTVMGDNSTATVQDCGAIVNNDPLGWWESFAISECADVTIDFCGTAPQRSPDWVFLYRNCPCGSIVGNRFANRSVCADNNVTMFFRALAAGTYFLPIFSTGPNSQGAYEMHITAEECTGACCDPETGGCTDDLRAADCDGANEGWSAGSKCCELECGSDGVTFNASGVKLLSNIPVADFPGVQDRANEMWGYVSPSGGEYAIIGFQKGTAFVDVNDPSSPIIIGYINGFVDTVPRDMATFGHYAYLTAGADFVGLQIVDLSDIDSGVITLANTTNLGVGYGEAHNLHVNPDSGFLYLAIPNLNGGLGLTVVDLNTDPVHPTVVGTWTDADEGVRCHDVHVVSYTTGPNAGKEIAFCPAEDDGLKIVDVTNKGNMFTISTLVYPNTTYAHQTRLSEDGQFVFLGDELDELSDPDVTDTTTYVINVSDLANPTLESTFSTGLCSPDHNMMVRGNFLFQANYTTGLRVFDVGNVSKVVEVGYFDTHPESNAVAFDGAWGVFSQYPSGIVTVSDRDRGLFVFDVSQATSRETVDCGHEISNILDDAVCVNEVTTGGTIVDLNVEILISHTWRGDLRITLDHKSTGTSVLLYDGPNTNPSGSDNLGNPLTGELLTFDDCAASALDNFVDDGDSPTGAWRSVESLSAFNGEDKVGEWNLTINDAFGGDQGVLVQYGLLFCDPAGGDCDSDIDLLAWGGFQICFSGADSPAPEECKTYDGDDDQDVDLQDYGGLGCGGAATSP